MKFLALFLLLISVKAQGLTLELANYASVHFKSDSNFNHIGDNRTTINPMVRLSNEQNWSLIAFKDSIGSNAMGITKSYLKPFNDRIQYGWGFGLYAINAKNWNELQFNKYWVQTGDIGLVPVIGPEIHLDIIEVDGFKLKNHNFATIGGLISFGLVISKEF